MKKLMKQWQEKAETVLTGLKKRFDVPMSELTTFKIGGPLDLLVEPENEGELERAVDFCSSEKVPWMVVGLGSNLLVRDKGIRGVGIRLAGIFKEYKVAGTKVTAGAGMALADLSKETAGLGLSGLEFACGIPGTVGGAVYMNAGAYNGEMAQVLAKVQFLDREQGLVWCEKKDLNLGYRSSRFQGTLQIVTRVELGLEYAERKIVEAVINDLTCRRQNKQPLEMPSAGSVFRRPAGYYVGPLVEQAGLKGFSIGGAQVSPKHAGFIVNTGEAKATDVLSLISHIQRVVRAESGVELIPEIKIIGDE